LFLLFCFVSLIDVSQKIFHAFNHFWRVKNCSLIAETANPRVKLVADFYMNINSEMSVVIRVIEYPLSVSEAFYHCIQKVVGKADFHKLFFTAEHRENTLRKGSHVYIFVYFKSVSRLFDDIHFLHSVKAVCNDILFIAVIGQKVVVAVINYQLVGAAEIELASPSGHLSCTVIDSVLEILEELGTQRKEL